MCESKRIWCGEDDDDVGDGDVDETEPIEVKIERLCECVCGASHVMNFLGHQNHRRTVHYGAGISFAMEL